MRRLLPPPPRHTPPPLHTWPDPLAQTYRPSSCYTAEPPSNDPFPPDDPVPPDVLAAFEHFGASGSLTYHALAHALRYFGVETTMAGAIDLLHQYDHPNGKHLDLAAFAKLIHDHTVGWEYAQQTQPQPQPQPQETQPQRVYMAPKKPSPKPLPENRRRWLYLPPVESLWSETPALPLQQQLQLQSPPPPPPPPPYTPVALPPYSGAIPAHHYMPPSAYAPPPYYSPRPALLYNHARPYVNVHALAARAGLEFDGHPLTLGEVFEMHDLERRGLLGATSLHAALSFLGAVRLTLFDTIDLVAAYGSPATAPGLDAGHDVACSFPEFASLVRTLRVRGDLPLL